jgi:peptidoglycan hydrolase CwlO-like protein
MKKAQIILFSILFFFIAIIIAWEVFNKFQLDSKITDLNSQIIEVATSSKKLESDIQKLDSTLTMKLSSASGSSDSSMGKLRDDITKLTDAYNKLSIRVDSVGRQASAAYWYLHDANGVN